ncbi:MAG: PDZ domain-containing protein [Chitinophagaceae bacterium]
MLKYFFKVIAVIAITGFLNIGAMAQQDNDKGKKDNEKSKLENNDEIIIRKKGDKDTKVTVEIKNGEVTINGKPLSEFDDDDNDIVVRKRRSQPMVRGYAAPGSPFRGENFNFNYNANPDAFNLATNRAFLGVITEKADDGVRISSITKGSAAEKAGLKENDVITKVDETAVSSPEDLTKAISKFNPEDKTVISYKRDKKEQKASVSLGKRSEATTMYRNNMEFNKNFDFENMVRPRLEALGAFNTGSPKLGIKAQDTEDGKGVKVLDVAEASNAQKAGIKEGDIITEFDGKTVNGAMELSDAARNTKDKSSIKVKVTRTGKTQDMEIKIPKKLKTANL